MDKKSVSLKKDDNRGELVDKIEVIEDTKKNKSRKVRVDTTSMKETTDDKIQESVENISIVMIIFIILACFVVGITLGFLLYRIAINNSSELSFIIKNYFNILHIYV